MFALAARARSIEHEQGEREVRFGVLDAGWTDPRKGFNCRLGALSVALDDDPELRMINARKMAQLKRRVELANAPKPQERSNRDIVMENLYDRGDEVLQAAYSYYPKETPIVVDYLAKYIGEHKDSEKISGGELLQVFRSLGLRFSLKTSIKVQEKGKFVDLKDKFKFNKEDEQIGG